MAYYTAEQPHLQGHESLFHILSEELLWQTLMHQGAANDCTCVDTHVVTQRRPNLPPCFTH